MEIADLYATLGLHPKESEWSRGDALIGKMKFALAGLIGLEAVKWFGGLIEKTQEQAVQSERLAQKLGITTEAVQQLSYAADVSGASVEEFQVSMQKLARGLDEFKTKGTGDVGTALSRLGISMSDTAIKSGNLDDQLMRIADGFADAGPNVNKTAIAMEIFGRSGTSLIPFLNRGRDGIKELRQEFIATGAQIDGDTSKSFEEFEADQKRLKYTLTGLRNEVVAALLPALKDLAEGAMDWIKANRELIKSTLTTIVQGLTYAVKGLGIAFEAVAAVIDFFREHTDLAMSVIIALGVVIAAFAVEAAISWALAFWPITLIIVAIAAVVLVVMDLWKSITTGKGVAASVFHWIRDQVNGVWQAIKNVGSAITDFFVAIGSGIKDAFMDAFNWVGDKLDWLEDKIRNAPVLKQLIDTGEWVSHKLGGDEAAAPATATPAPSIPATAHDDARMRVLTTAALPPGSPATAGARGPVTVTQNVKVSINGVTDPAAVGQIVDKKIKESTDKLLIHAHAAVGGDQPGQ